MRKHVTIVWLCLTWMAVAAAAQTTVTNSNNGTTNTVPVYTGSSTLGNSPISVSGSNVGIGTTSPSYPLDVTGTVRASQLQIDHVVSIGPSGTHGIGVLGGDNAFAGQFYGITGGGFQFTNSRGANTITLLDNGDVGIGTTTPNSELQIWDSNTSRPGGVAAATDSVFRLSRAGTLNYSYDEGAEFRIGHGGSYVYGSQLDLYINGGSNTNGIPDRQAMTWLYNGNVGIGTTNPLAPLHVFGGTQNSYNLMSWMQGVAANTGTSYIAQRMASYGGAYGYGGEIAGFLTQGVGGGLTLSTVNNAAL